MAELYKVSNLAAPASHAVFIHGLGGSYKRTWSSAGDERNRWPTWLCEEVSGLEAWLVDYDASVSRWRGNAMHLPDRADNLLMRLLAESALSTGDIALVGHSLGGLLIKQLLRTADSSARQNAAAASFVGRVRRVAFIATPHSGAKLATVADRARRLIRPSLATQSLASNDPSLRDLQHWYRDWAAANEIQHLVLTETRPMKPWGMIVQPSSADLGLVRPVPIDADHVSITRLRNRSDQAYLAIKALLQQIQPGPAKAPTVGALMAQGRRPVSGVADSPLAGPASEGNPGFSAPLGERPFPTHLVDEQIRSRLAVVRRGRFFEEKVRSELAPALGASLSTGELAGGSAEARALALSWCARVLVLGDRSEEARTFLRQAETLAALPDVKIAQAFECSRSDAGMALNILAEVNSPAAKTAALLVVFQKDGLQGGLDWLATANLTVSDLDSEGRFLLIQRLLEAEHWDDALSYAQGATEEDYEAAPPLLFACGLAELMQAIPTEFRSAAVGQLPFEVGSFPLSSDAGSLVARRKAEALFKACSQAALSLGCEAASDRWAEYALWLQVRDPARGDLGKEALRADLRNPTLSLRRVYLAVQFGLKLDLKAVEREIDSQTALTGGLSRDAALARFALAFTQNSPAEVADYIGRHRKQILNIVPEKTIGHIEVEMLARAGRKTQAEEVFSRISSDLSEGEARHLGRIVAEISNSDPIELREEEYKANSSLQNLTNLVAMLEGGGHWGRLLDYAEALFSSTRSLEAAETLVRCLNELSLYARIYGFLEQFPEFVEQSEQLKLHWAWALFRNGSIGDAARTLAELRKANDRAAFRVLAANIAIVGGAWDDLLPLVEEEWANRDARNADELLRAALLAQSAGSSRSVELAKLAAGKAAENAHVLTAAYSLAATGGWESEPDVANWLQSAASLSTEESGPIQQVSLRELIDRQPDWRRRETEAWDGIADAHLPVFLAAQVLRRSLLDMFLLPALANPLEPDVRRRSIIPAYAGTRREVVLPSKAVGFDPTALLTMWLIGLLEPAIAFLAPVRIPHSTLSWLFEGKQRVAFHQPSQVVRARELRDLLATGSLRALEVTAQLNSDLALEVGDDLAALIAEAFNDSDSAEPKVVVRPYPVHRIQSLMEEIADLSAYEQRIVSCHAVVEKLSERGQITTEEKDRAISYLSLHEVRWPGEVAIKDGSLIYLDDVSVSYFQNLRLLDRLKPAGLTAFIPTQEIDDANNLIVHEQRTSDVLAAIEEMRKIISAGILSGKVLLDKIIQSEDDGEEDIRHHPCISTLALPVDIVVIDDRALNRHVAIDNQHAKVGTTMDVVETLRSEGVISDEAVWSAKTKLRRAAFMCVSISREELAFHLSNAQVKDGAVVESAELRAIRENILKIRMSTYLQPPIDMAWLQATMDVFAEAIHRQWRDGNDDERQVAISNWLVSLTDLRGWMHRLGGGLDSDLSERLHVEHLMRLIALQTDLNRETSKRYREWLDGRLVAPLLGDDPALHRRLVESAKAAVGRVAAGPERGAAS